jgi:hypothetical protein
VVEAVVTEETTSEGSFVNAPLAVEFFGSVDIVALESGPAWMANADTAAVRVAQRSRVAQFANRGPGHRKSNNHWWTTHNRRLPFARNTQKRC